MSSPVYYPEPRDIIASSLQTTRRRPGALCKHWRLMQFHLRVFLPSRQSRRQIHQLHERSETWKKHFNNCRSSSSSSSAMSFTACTQTTIALTRTMQSRYISIWFASGREWGKYIDSSLSSEKIWNDIKSAFRTIFSPLSVDFLRREKFVFTKRVEKQSRSGLERKSIPRLRWVN